MLKKIAILGLLLDGPKHGYEIKRIVDDVLSRLVSVSTGAIYYAIKKLEQEGCIRLEKTRDGARPERHICHITEAGRSEFRQLLHKNLYTGERPHWDFNLSIFFLGSLDQGELRRALEGRVQHLERVVEHVTSVNQIVRDPAYGYAGTFLTEHYLEHAKVDLRMYQRLLADVLSGKATAGPEKTFQDYWELPTRPRPPKFPF